MVIKFKDVHSLVFEDGGFGHIWALYDNIDHKPRLYALIARAGSSKILRWLKYCPLTKVEKEWKGKELPVACGRFFLGEKDDIHKYKGMYSHTVEWNGIYVEKASEGNSAKETLNSHKKTIFVIEIYPKKGEVWALYKGWSMQWSSDAENHMPYEYEVVEVLSDMSHNGSATVIPLVRITGFSSLFAAAMDKSSFDIPSSEILRFSHQIPSYRITGDENILRKINNGPTVEKKVAVPEGFLLLNSDCLLADLDVSIPSVSIDAYMSQIKKSGSIRVISTTGATNTEVDLGNKQLQKQNHFQGQVCEPMSTDNNENIPSKNNIALQENTHGSNQAGDLELSTEITIAEIRRKSASRKRPRSNKVRFSDDEHSHDPKYSGAKRSTKELQLQKVTALAEGSQHASVYKMTTPLSASGNSSASIHRTNHFSLLYGHSAVPKIDASNNVQNQLNKRKLLRKVCSRKIASKIKECEEPHSLHKSLELPGKEKKIGTKEGARSQRKSFLTLESTKSTKKLLDRTKTYQEPVTMVHVSFEAASNDIDKQSTDEHRHNDVTYQEPVAPVHLSFDATSNDIDKQSTDELRHNDGTQVPFIKTSEYLWTEIEEMDIFKEFPQQPHFHPLQEHLPELREQKAFSLMMSFNHFVQSLRNSSIEENEGSYEQQKCILDELKSNGFEVQHFESLLHEVMKVKFECTKDLEELSAVQEEKLGAAGSLSRKDSILCQIDEAMAEHEQEIGRHRQEIGQHRQKIGQLRKKAQLVEKERENDEEKLSRLNAVESSVKKALDAKKLQLHSILAGIQPKQLI